MMFYSTFALELDHGKDEKKCSNGQVPRREKNCGWGANLLSDFALTVRARKSLTLE